MYKSQDCRLFTLSPKTWHSMVPKGMVEVVIESRKGTRNLQVTTFIIKCSDEAAEFHFHLTSLLARLVLK